MEKTLAPFELSRRWLGLGAALLGLCAGGGCLMQGYPGPARGPAEVAIIRPALGMAGTQILLESVDGRALRWLQERATVLPGPHRLRVSLLLRSGVQQRVHRFDLGFEARAGERYWLFGELSAHGPRLWIADAELATVAEADTGLGPPPVGAGGRERPSPGDGAGETKRPRGAALP